MKKAWRYVWAAIDELEFPSAHTCLGRLSATRIEAPRPSRLSIRSEGPAPDVRRHLVPSGGSELAIRDSTDSIRRAELLHVTSICAQPKTRLHARVSSARTMTWRFRAQPGTLPENPGMAKWCRATEYPTTNPQTQLRTTIFSGIRPAFAEPGARLRADEETGERIDNAGDGLNSSPLARPPSRRPVRPAPGDRVAPPMGARGLDVALAPRQPEDPT